MEQSKRIKSNPALSLSIKIVIAVAAVWFIYKRVFERENIQNLFDEYRTVFSNSSKRILFCLILLLMFFNWSVEAIKWRMMIRKIQTITFLRSLEAVFSGLTISFFTPNRIGEYAGRVFHLEAHDRIKATLITVIENLSQLLITIVAGSIALLFFLHTYVEINGYFLLSLSVLVCLFIFGCAFLFLNVSILETMLNRFRKTKSLSKYTEVFSYYSHTDLLKVVMLAAVRYFIFTTQFYLLLILFDVQLPYFVSLVLLAMIYYVMSLVPTIALTEIGVRGAVATFFFDRVTDQSASVLNATVSLWLINLAFPALIGTVFVFMFNLEKQKTG